MKPMTEDITTGHHGGNEESTAAHARLEPNLTAQRRRVLEACSRQGGVTCRILAEEWGVGMNTISGRFSELKKAGLIRKIGVIDHCGVYQVSP